MEEGGKKKKTFIQGIRNMEHNKKRTTQPKKIDKKLKKWHHIQNTKKNKFLSIKALS